jgi:predicted metal-dependent phosphoesterase TrpH
MRADFHMHTFFSPDCLTSPERLIKRCLNVGLGCIAITDHNTIAGAVAVKRLAPFPVIVAAEIKSSAGEITGLFLNKDVPSGLSPLDTLDRIKDQGGLVSIPHPFDGVRSSVIRPEALEEILPFADLIEVFNARNTFKGANQKAEGLAQLHNLLPTAVSDSHHVFELGRTYTEIPEFDGSAEGFKLALKEAVLVKNQAIPWVHFFSTYAKLHKRVANAFTN